MRAPSLLASLVLLGAGAACPLLGSPGIADPQCSVHPSSRAQAIYEPPQMIAILVPEDDGGVRECQAGTKPGCDTLLATECPVFLTTAVGTETSIELGVVNLSYSIDLQIKSVTFDEGFSDPAFTIGDFPSVIAPQEVAPLVVRFAPTVAATAGASLRIVSDALNAKDGTVLLSIEGTGTE